MGFGAALGLPVAAYSRDHAETYFRRVKKLDAVEVGQRYCVQHGMLVEDFGLPDNLMLVCGSGVWGPLEEAVEWLAGRLRGVRA
jgi:nucleoside 2-deoxyribosyltransferase